MAIFKKADPALARIAAGRTDLVVDYVAAGHPATARDDGGSSLLYWCARYGDVSAMRFLIAHGEHLDSIRATIGLEGAAFFGHWRLCEFLLENGADVDLPNAETAETPLHAALCKPNRPAFELVVRVLLAAGADPNRRTKPGAGTGAFMRDCRTRGETPLHRAAAFAPGEYHPAAAGCRSREGHEGREWRFPAELGELAHPAGHDPSLADLR